MGTHFFLAVCLLTFFQNVLADTTPAEDSRLPQDIEELVNEFNRELATNEKEKLFLELTTKFHAANESDVASFEFPEELKVKIQKRYTDPYSGLQALLVLAEVEGESKNVFLFGATQVAVNPALSGRLDKRDIFTVLSYGLPQLESLAALEIREDARRLITAGQKVYLTGQSLGGILSHGLGYLTMFDLKREGNSELMEKISVLSWVLPGIAPVIKDYMAKYHEDKNYLLDPEITSQDFVAIYSEIDPLLKIGEGFGTERIIPAERLLMALGKDYIHKNPGFKLMVEAHLYPALKVALDEEVIPVEAVPVDNSDKIQVPKLIRNFLRHISYGALKRMYLKYLSEQGGPLDWEKCYQSDRWSTNLTKKCTSRDQEGCEVGLIYLVKETGSRLNRSLEVEWCLPAINPISQQKLNR